MKELKYRLNLELYRFSELSEEVQQQIYCRQMEVEYPYLSELVDRKFEMMIRKYNYLTISNMVYDEWKNYYSFDVEVEDLDFAISIILDLDEEEDIEPVREAFEEAEDKGWIYRSVGWGDPIGKYHIYDPEKITPQVKEVVETLNDIFDTLKWGLEEAVETIYETAQEDLWTLLTTDDSLYLYDGRYMGSEKIILEEQHQIK